MELVPAFTARTLSADSVRLTEDLPVTEDPRRASGDFQADQLLAFAVTDEQLAAGSLAAGTSWQVAVTRSMARHGSSALDTEITVRLLLPAQAGAIDAEAPASRAMMRLALALASPELGVVEPQWSGSLA
ncbi:hypothetical protein [Luteococcus peritonei]|uniref:Uncharacterized protein n=1 Tax=Luteococcus peritonei TaxID=88874 RepID=A0ABW4RTX5_9ACTN